jgi:hypothetical protein
MKFCTVCNNIYTMKINTENKNQSLKLICNNCGNEEIETNTCILKDNNEYDNMVISNKNKLMNICEDITIPRVNHIKCINDSCKSNEFEFNKKKEKDNEVVYFQTNEKNMSYQYICCLCYTTWTNK